EIDADVLVEIAVLDHLERRRQELRDLIGRHHDAILAVNGEDAADEQRIEPEDRHVFAAPVAHGLDRVAAGCADELLRRLQRAPEAESSGDELDALAVAAVAACLSRCGAALVAEALELALQRICAERLSDIELGRFGVDLRRQRPAAAFELRGDLPVEIENPGQQSEYGEAQDQHDAGEDLLAVFPQST